MKKNRLILLVESRIRGDVYVRFGGEHPKTHRRNTAGRWMLSLPYASKIENINLAYNADRRVLTQRWINQGDEAIFTGLKTKNSYITDRYIQDEKTFECSNVNVTYNFPQKWVSQLGFDRLSATASIGNVFYLSTIRQERGTSYPFAIQPSFGLSCAF